MKNEKIVWLSAFKHVIPSDFEAWMEEQASQGWQVDKIGQWSSIRMNFKKSEPKKYRYIYDMQVTEKKDYKNIYAQFGWEFVGQMASAYVWRKEYSDLKPESFSDKESIEKRNKNFMYAVSVSFFIFLTVLITISILFVKYYSLLDADDLFQFILGFVLSAGAVFYLSWVMRKIYKNRFN